jgi:hypothetical protein
MFLIYTTVKRKVVKHYAMKAYGGVDVYIHIFLTSALAGGECSAWCPDSCTTKERAPGSHWIGWVDPRADLDVENRNFLTLPGLEIKHLIQPVASHYTDYAIPNIISNIRHIFFPLKNQGTSQIREMCTFPIFFLKSTFKYWMHLKFKSILHSKYYCMCMYVSIRVYMYIYIRK